MIECSSARINQERIKQQGIPGMGDGFSDEDISSALRVLNGLPDYFCWKSTNLQYVMMNDATAKLFGFESSSVSYNRISDHDLKCDAAALATDFRTDDKMVLDTGDELTIFNFCQYANNEWKLLFGRKSVLYNDKNEKKGVYSRFLDVTNCPTFKMILGLCSFDHNQVTYVIKDRFDHYNLSARESEIVFYLLRGRTAKEIAVTLNLSFRTVEKHMERIKTKMGCYNKSQLVEKAWSLGLSGYLPHSILNLPTHSAFNIAHKGSSDETMEEPQ